MQIELTAQDLITQKTALWILITAEKPSEPNCMQPLKNILLVLSTGYIFVYFSEHLFWARIRPEDSLASWISTWIVYSLLSFLFLSIVEHFRVRDIWSLFLAGAAFGWLAEGLVTQTAYERLPLSISFTGLAWHDLLTIWIGWYAIRKSLIASGLLSTLMLATSIGLCSGLWAISWWLEPGVEVPSLSDFAIFSLSTTSLVILAYGLANWSSSALFVPNRWLTMFTIGLFIIYFLVKTIPSAPVAIIILPALLGLIYFSLQHSRDSERNNSFINSLNGHVSGWKLLSLMALPAASIGIYMLAFSFNVRWHTNWILYFITTPLGFIVFGISLFISWRDRLAHDIHF